MINDYCHHRKDNCCISDLPSSKREKVGSKSFGHVLVAPPKRQPSIFLTQLTASRRLLLDTVYQAADLRFQKQKSLMIWWLINRIRFQKTNRNCDLSKVKVQYLLGARFCHFVDSCVLEIVCGKLSTYIGPSKEGWNKERTIFLRPFPGTSVRTTMMLEASCWTVARVPIPGETWLFPVVSSNQIVKSKTKFEKSTEKCPLQSGEPLLKPVDGTIFFLFVGFFLGPPSPVKSDPTQTGWRGKSFLY